MALPEISQIPMVADNTPAAHAEAITNSIDVTLDRPSRGVFVGSSGDIIVNMVAAPTVEITFKNVPSGTMLPLGIIKVNGTDEGHTADDLVIVY